MAERYSGEEVQRIIARAVELENELRAGSPTDKPEADVFNEADLDRIAGEVGIPQQALRLAIAEHRSPPVEVGFEGTTARVRRAVSGTLDDEALRRLEREVTSIITHEASSGPLGLPGTTDVGSSAIRYRSGYLKEQMEGHKLQFTIRSTGRSVELDLSDDMSNNIIGLYGGLVGGAGLGMGLGIGLGIGLGVLGSAAFSLIFPVVTIAGMYGLARRLVQQFKAKRTQEVRRIAESILAAIRAETTRDHDERSQEDS